VIDAIHGDIDARTKLSVHGTDEDTNTLTTTSTYSYSIKLPKTSD
jgi:hypothetical protein